MAILVIVMCVAIFACVASTLAWDVQGALSGYGVGGYGGGYGGGYSSFGGAGYGAGNYYGYGSVGGNYNDPRSAKGFIIAMAGIIFITCLVVFIIIVSHQSLSESRRFYLAVLITCAILAPLMFIAAIVYLMAVNPMAQANGSIYAMQIQGLCAQYQSPQASGMLVNQYLYHYCVLEPQEVNTHIFNFIFLCTEEFCSFCDPLCCLSFQAVAAVLAFLVAVALIVMLVFALKTRQKIRNYGKSNILWKKVKVLDDTAPPPDVEEWVSDSVSSVVRRIIGYGHISCKKAKHLLILASPKGGLAAFFLFDIILN